MGGQTYKKRQEGVAAYQNHQSCELVMLIHLERSSFTHHPTPPHTSKQNRQISSVSLRLNNILWWRERRGEEKNSTLSKPMCHTWCYHHLQSCDAVPLLLRQTQRCLILRAKAPPSFGNMPICSCLTKSESTFLIFWFLISAWTQWEMWWLILGLY